MHAGVCACVRIGTLAPHTQPAHPHHPAHIHLLLCCCFAQALEIGQEEGSCPLAGSGQTLLKTLSLAALKCYLNADSELVFQYATEILARWADVSRAAAELEQHQRQSEFSPLVTAADLRRLLLLMQMDCAIQGSCQLTVQESLRVAEAAAQQLIEEQPGNAAHLHALSRIYFEMGDHVKELDALRSALRAAKRCKGKQQPAHRTLDMHRRLWVVGREACNA